jgi:hypothetical protein
MVFFCLSFYHYSIETPCLADDIILADSGNREHRQVNIYQNIPPNFTDRRLSLTVPGGEVPCTFENIIFDSFPDGIYHVNKIIIWSFGITGWVWKYLTIYMFYWNLMKRRSNAGR